MAKIFQNSEFGVIEIITIDGKEYFPAVDTQRNFTEGESKWKSICRNL